MPSYVKAIYSGIVVKKWIEYTCCIIGKYVYVAPKSTKRGQKGKEINKRSKINRIEAQLVMYLNQQFFDRAIVYM